MGWKPESRTKYWTGTGKRKKNSKRLRALKKAKDKNKVKF